MTFLGKIHDDGLRRGLAKIESLLLDIPRTTMAAGKPSTHASAESSSQAPPWRLPRYLAGCYLLLVVYASLHPFSGWQSPGLSPFVFLEAAWPRYWTGFDLAINIAAYLPLGFLLAPALKTRHGQAFAALQAFMWGTLTSFSIETLQSFLPSRVPSSLDLLCNGIGTGVGAILATWYGATFFASINDIQRQFLARLPHSEYGLVLTGLWMITQLSPETVLFGSGDLRQLFSIVPPVPYAAHSFFAMETGIIICNMLAVGLLIRTFLLPRANAYLAMLGFFLLALSIRTLGAIILIGPQSAFAWLSPGAGLGLMLGGALLLGSQLLPRPARIALAGLALMAGTVLVNITPFNPYSVAALTAWRQGHFLNFNGLTRLTASFWPFLSLPYLILLGRRI